MRTNAKKMRLGDRGIRIVGGDHARVLIVSGGGRAIFFISDFLNLFVNEFYIPSINLYNAIIRDNNTNYTQARIKKVTCFFVFSYFTFDRRTNF